eukprot:scaffold10667_cov132-Isochrysis_galbana.AAC.1
MSGTASSAVASMGAPPIEIDEARHCMAGAEVLGKRCMSSATAVGIAVNNRIVGPTMLPSPAPRGLSMTEPLNNPTGH